MTLVRTTGHRARWCNRSVCVGLMLAASLLAAAGCSEAPKHTKEVAPVIIRDVPDVLRGTIGAEASINGTQPQLVSGLGIVVHLNETGGGNLTPAVSTTMERELAMHGVGRGGNAGGALEGMSPQEFLRSKRVAVVIVEAKVPPGAPEDAAFDVMVRTLPGSSVTSLEGGVLWSTDLRLGPPTTFGGYKTRRLAVAAGPIYINPFAEPGSGGDMGVTRTVGRVLDGGRMVEPLKLELVLDTDSHSRARTMVAAINGRFPREPGESGETARGRGSEAGSGGSRQSIAISVPRKYKDRAAEFLQLLRYTRVDPSYPEEFARRYVEELKVNTALSEQLGWCLKAIGKPAIPFLVPLYDYPELAPRLTALEAGASLGDARAAPHLIDLARTATPGIKTQAIKLLARMPFNPQINVALRDLVNSPELDVKVAAWEALSDRNDPSILRENIGSDPTRPKFILETVPSSDTMIYVTQQGEPRIVIFGNAGGGGHNGDQPGIRINRPTLVTAWSDRLMIAADTPTSDIRLRYLSGRTGEAVQSAVPSDLTGFVEFLAHKPTPEDPGPGLDFSYSDVVGALYELSRQGGVSAVFATEQDLLRAEIYEASQATVLADRPETTAADDPAAATADTIVFRPRTPTKIQGVEDTPAQADWKPRIVPLTRPAPPPPK